MPRRTRCRRVEFFPDITSFVPLGKNQDNIEKVVLNLEELEAIRLKDVEGLTQQECADKMGVSRQTFQNIIDKARNKVAIALTNGFIISITGGCFKSPYCEIECRSCHTIYSIKYPRDRKMCPNCHSLDVHCNNKDRKCNRWCQR